MKVIAATVRSEKPGARGSGGASAGASKRKKSEFYKTNPDAVRRPSTTCRGDVEIWPQLMVVSAWRQPLRASKKNREKHLKSLEKYPKNPRKTQNFDRFLRGKFETVRSYDVRLWPCAPSESSVSPRNGASVRARSANTASALFARSTPSRCAPSRASAS
jgi:hypothetical protein